MEQLVGAKTIARLLFGDERRTDRVYALVRQDRIPHVRLGERGVRFDVARLRFFLAEGGDREPGAWRLLPQLPGSAERSA